MHPDELAFQRAMDADRFERSTYLVFADWLQERGDPRAAGYRALGTLGLSPRHWMGEFKWYDGSHQWVTNIDKESDLPDVWFTLTRKMKRVSAACPFRTRRKALDAAARAWLLLTDAERATILSPTLTAGAV